MANRLEDPLFESFHGNRLHTLTACLIHGTTRHPNPALCGHRSHEQNEGVLGKAATGDGWPHVAGRDRDSMKFCGQESLPRSGNTPAARASQRKKLWESAGAKDRTESAVSDSKSLQCG